jgi:hypothetical protein
VIPKLVTVQLKLPHSLVSRLEFIAEQSLCAPESVMRVLLTISMMQRRSDLAAAMPPVPPRPKKRKRR